VARRRARGACINPLPDPLEILLDHLTLPAFLGLRTTEIRFESKMAVRSSCRVAVLVLVLVLLLLALVASPPRGAAAARVLLPAAGVAPRSGGEAPPGNDGKRDGSAAAGSGFRGPPPPEFGGRRVAVAGNAARVMGSVPSPGVGH
jgi:hypothetical protein